MTKPLDVQPPLVPVKLITGHEAPTVCPFCSAPRHMVDGARVAFACNSGLTFSADLPGEQRKVNPKPKQTLKCIALAKAGGWKGRAA